MDSVTEEDLQTWVQSPSWIIFKKKYPRKALWLQSVMKTAYKTIKKNETKPFKFSNIGIGLCDLVTAAVIIESGIQKVPYKFTWVSVIKQSRRHYVLFDLNLKFIIDLTEIQFKSGQQALVFHVDHFSDLGYEENENEVESERNIRNAMSEYLNRYLSR